MPRRLISWIEPPKPKPQELTIFPIPLRPGVVVKVHIPYDLTQAEAGRIAEVVKAFAVVPKPKSNLRELQRRERQKEDEVNAAWRSHFHR